MRVTLHCSEGKRLAELCWHKLPTDVNSTTTLLVPHTTKFGTGKVFPEQTKEARMSLLQDQVFHSQSEGQCVLCMCQCLDGGMGALWAPSLVASA